MSLTTCTPILVSKYPVRKRRQKTTKLHLEKKQHTKLQVCIYCWLVSIYWYLIQLYRCISQHYSIDYHHQDIDEFGRLYCGFLSKYSFNFVGKSVITPVAPSWNALSYSCSSFKTHRYVWNNNIKMPIMIIIYPPTVGIALINSNAKFFIQSNLERTN